MNENIVLRNTKVIWRNFAGAEGKFNRAGDRNFTVVIEDLDLANNLIASGWNLKAGKPDESTGMIDEYFLKVSVSYKYRGPRIRLIRPDGIVEIEESTADILDYADFDRVDLNIAPYHWEVNGTTGIKAYLESAKFWIKVDPLDEEE